MTFLRSLAGSCIQKLVHVPSWLVSLITDVQKLLFSLCFSLGASHSKCSCHASFQNRVPLNLDFPAQHDIPQSFLDSPMAGCRGRAQPGTGSQKLPTLVASLDPGGSSGFIQGTHGNPLIPTVDTQHGLLENPSMNGAFPIRPH